MFAKVDLGRIKFQGPLVEKLLEVAYDIIVFGRDMVIKICYIHSQVKESDSRCYMKCFIHWIAWISMFIISFFLLKQEKTRSFYREAIIITLILRKTYNNRIRFYISVNSYGYSKKITSSWLWMRPPLRFPINPHHQLHHYSPANIVHNLTNSVLSKLWQLHRWRSTQFCIILRLMHWQLKK